MYLKAVTIKGFKTYRFETRISFSPGYNCIVGSNGSGKSNILLAVAFALGEGGHTAAERRLLLHEGVSERVEEGSVEVVLSNSDRRLCMYDEDEISLRRVFTALSDEVYVQGKRVNKAALQQLLECAGFGRGSSSSSSKVLASSLQTHAPYFIQQGRIGREVLQSSGARLVSLLAAAGGAGFAEKSKETQLLLQQGRQQATRLGDSLILLRRKLQALAADSEELRNCMQLEQHRDACEYVLAERKWSAAAAALHRVEELLLRETEQLKSLESRAGASEAHKQQLQQQRQQLELQQRMQTEARGAALESLASWRAEEEAVRLQLQALENEEQQQQQQTSYREQQLQQLRQKLSQIEKKLNDELHPAAARAKSQLQQTQQQLQQTQQQFQQLQCRQQASRARRAGDKGGGRGAAAAAGRGGGSGRGGKAARAVEQRAAAAARRGEVPELQQQHLGAEGKRSLPGDGEADMQREIRHAEGLAKEENELLKRLHQEVERLKEEETSLQSELEAHTTTQREALQSLREAEAKERQLSQEFEAATENKRTLQAALTGLMQQQNIIKSARHEAEAAFWQQLRSDLREGLQAAIAYAHQQGWRNGSNTSSNSSSNSSSNGCSGDNSSDGSTGGSSEDGGGVGPQQQKEQAVAGLLLDFIEVLPEYRRAVEAVASHALVAYLVPDAAAAAALLQQLKTSQQPREVSRSSAAAAAGRKRGSDSTAAATARRGGRGCFSLTAVPLKEVAALQHRRERNSIKRMRRKKYLETLEAEGKALSIADHCIQVRWRRRRSSSGEGYEEDEEDEAAADDAAADWPAATSSSSFLRDVAAYVRSVFGRAVLVPSLKHEDGGGHGLVKELLDNGFDCVTVDGDVAFSSGLMRGGSGGDPVYSATAAADSTADGSSASSSSKLLGSAASAKAAATAENVALQPRLLSAVPLPGKIQAYKTWQQRMRDADELQQRIEETQQQIKAVEVKHGALIEEEQLFAEARAKQQAAIKKAVTVKQQAEHRLRVIAQRRVAVEAQATGAAARVKNLKNFIQTLRRESVSPDGKDELSSAEEQQLLQLQEQLRRQQHELQQQEQQVAAADAAVQQLETEAEGHLRRQIARLEGEAAAAAAAADEAAEKRELERHLAALNRWSLGAEDTCRKADRQLQLLERDLREKEEELVMVDQQQQEILQQLEGTLQALQRLSHEAETARRVRDEAENILRGREEGGGEAAATDGALQLLQLLRQRAVDNLQQQLRATKKQLQKFEHVNRKAVDQTSTLQEEYDNLQRRQQQQEETRQLIAEQLQLLQRRKQQMEAHFLRRVDEELRSIFASLSRGGHAELVLQRRSSSSSFQQQRSSRSRLLPLREEGEEEEEQQQSTAAESSAAAVAARSRRGGGEGAAATRSQRGRSSSNSAAAGESPEEAAAAAAEKLPVVGVDIRVCFLKDGAAAPDPTADGARAARGSEEEAPQITAVEIAAEEDESEREKGMHTAAGDRRRLRSTPHEQQDKAARSNGVLLQQLSGGQKSLVALALLLAVQRVACCWSSSPLDAPLPAQQQQQPLRERQQQQQGTRTTGQQEEEQHGDFDGAAEEEEETEPDSSRSRGMLLLDEPDAALDEAYCRRAAAVLKDSTAAAATQVILSTFRPELVEPADRIYKIYQVNRVSYVQRVDALHALQLLQEQQRPAPEEDEDRENERQLQRV